MSARAHKPTYQGGFGGRGDVRGRVRRRRWLPRADHLRRGRVILHRVRLPLLHLPQVGRRHLEEIVDYPSSKCLRDL